jgi:S-adenosylmethionine hydrolase
VTPSGVITLTTDFGHRDPFVGVVKGAVLTRFAQARLIDLTHEISPHRPAEAGFWLARAYRYFPGGTVHVAVVDPGVGTARAILAVRASGHLFLAPDNGLLAPVVARAQPECVVRVDTAALARLGVEHASATFHGRDIFAPLAAELACGRIEPEALGAPLQVIVPGEIPEPEVGARELRGNIVTIDHFGNLITNIDAALLKRFSSFEVEAGGRTFASHRTYADAPAGEYLVLVNSFEVLEIARTQGSAAAGLSLSRGAPVVVRGHVV